jgi:PAS domain S-box-containing protein
MGERPINEPMPRFDFQEIVERLPLVVYIDELDERSSPLYVSPEIERLLGYTREEWLADPDLFQKSLHPDDRDWVLAGIAVRNSSHVSMNDADYRLIARDGRVVWVRDDEVVIAGENGSRPVSQGYMQDVTSRRRDRMRLELLVGILGLAAEERTPEEIVREAAVMLAAAVGDVDVTFVEIEPDGTLRARYSTEYNGPVMDTLAVPGYLEQLAAGPIVVDDVTKAPWLADVQDELAEQGVGSAVDVPLRRDGAIVGVLWFNTPEARTWHEHEVTVLTEVAEQLATVLANAWAREERRRAEQVLRNRDAILEAVSHGAERLLAERSWRNAAPALLEELGRGSGASRAYLFEVVPSADEKVHMTQRFEWVAEGVRPQIASPDLPDFCLEDAGLDRQLTLLRAQEIFSVAVADLPEDERAFYVEQGIKSILTVPIVVGDLVWGTIGFDDCVAERTWSAAEKDALRTAASLLAAAIERERSEGVLREHEQTLRAVFETALDAIFITDGERRYVDVNPAGCEYLGVAKRDLIGRRFDDFLPPSQLETVEEDWAAYLAGGPVLEEWESMRLDGTIRVAEASAHPNFLPGLNIAFLRDITERKQLEAELVNAQKLESLGRLAGGVAHDFNNLLTGITGYATLLLERANGDGELRRDLGEIVRAAERAAELTKQLLAFGRRQVLKPRPLDLREVVAELRPLLERLLGEDIALEVRDADELGTVRADPGQIEQVIVNLAVNARDAMPNGGRFTIETRNRDRYVDLVCTDTGTGMEEATLAQIFEPFFTTREQGVGLGLASVHGIVHQSSGEVAVESTPGVGSTFTISLPRVLETPGNASPAEERDARPGSETILLVEDEDVVRDLTRRVLERQGYTVLACADGPAAVALAEAEDRKIDLLLTDVVMPGMRGYEVARLVSQSRPEIRVLFMSGYAEEALVGRAALADHPLIEKPFAVDVLTRRVRETLEP